MEVLFQHTAARRRLIIAKKASFWEVVVSTHSRPKAAELGSKAKIYRVAVSTHSRPKAAEQFGSPYCANYSVSTHSRPKAADFDAHNIQFVIVSFNTQPPEGG